MRLINLRLQDFRNHSNSSFEFGDGINILLGDNGQGKTNVIEAISYLCLTKSFYAGSDALVLSFAKEIFTVEGTFVFEHGAECTVRVAYAGAQSEKVFTINKKQIEPFSSVIGKFPIVVCSPEHGPITTGAPSERRKFIDFIISQSSAIYFHDLLEYRRVVKHRNKILFDAKILRRDAGILLEPWDEQLVALGSAIITKRLTFVDEFQSYISSAYHRLVGGEEEPTIEYKPLLKFEHGLTEEQIQHTLRLALQQKRYEEQRTGTTLVGPHRDELSMQINGLDLRKFASQGQHKTYLVALKMGEFFYLKDRCNETPMLLLDDVFSELDESRAARLLSFAGELSQTFITSTNPNLFEGAHSTEREDKKFFIHNGAVMA
jgi:DNA replication and repair protein RecF